MIEAGCFLLGLAQLLPSPLGHLSNPLPLVIGVVGVTMGYLEGLLPAVLLGTKPNLRELQIGLASHLLPLGPHLGRSLPSGCGVFLYLQAVFGEKALHGLSVFLRQRVKHVTVPFRYDDGVTLLRIAYT